MRSFRLPESGRDQRSAYFAILVGSVHNKMQFKTGSKRPLIFVVIISLVIVVIVGVVTWKLTKDAYETFVSSASEIKGTTKTPEASTDQTTKKAGYTEEEIREKPWLSLRMLRDVLPVHYDITMFPDFYGNHGEFYGNETIELEVNKPTRYIIIHIHTTYINVTGMSLFDNITGERIDITRNFTYIPNEFLVIEAARLVDRAAVLHLSFKGSLTKAIVGIYKSTYYNTLTNEKRPISSSKFEPTFARQAFPCFDEPNIKAEYTITLIHKPEYIALSNMPRDGNITQVTWSPDLVATRFQRSVKMSTYLVCFTVCDFKYVETTSEKGIPIRVYATPDKVNQTQYALDMAKYTLDAYETLFNMTYPLPKQDLIAIPDFVSGAMEHWGLISFRESRLLYDPNQASLSSMENVALTVAHEMAHQWFGNIVTMDWWNDLWLNEGFASFIEYIGVAGKETDWDEENVMLVSDLLPVMKEDSELSSHPIIVNVENPNQITSVFDTISYSKGCSVIRMLESIMGKKNFFGGVTEYLQEFQWGNAKTDDLWNSLSNYDNVLNVKHIMDTWTIQDGFPYVNITIETLEAGLSNFTIQQKRFLSNPNAAFNPSSSPFRYKWYITLDYKSLYGDYKTKIMDQEDQISFLDTLDLTINGTWVKFNYKQQGFYRVLYPDFMWKRFSDHLLNTSPLTWELADPDRAGLLSDAFSLAAAGLTSYEIPLTMMSYLNHEKSFIPWVAAMNDGIYYITTMLKTDPEFGLWKKFVVEKLQFVLKNMTYEDEGSHNERKLRAGLMNMAGDVGDDYTIEVLKAAFHDWLANNKLVSVNLRSPVYKNGMFYGGTESDWEQIWKKYLVEPSPQEKELLALSLSYVQHPHLIAKLLDFAKREDGIMRQDFFTVVRNVGSNIAAMSMVWDWARENYQLFTDRYTVADRSFGRMIYYMVKDYNSKVKLKEVKDFFALYPEAGAGDRYRQMAVESIERNIYWMKTFRPVIINWLKNKQ